MASSIVDAFKQAILTKKPVRQDPNLTVVSHCVAQALALTPTELTRVTAGVRPSGPWQWSTSTLL